MTTVETAAPAETSVRMIELIHLAESPNNPRKSYGDMEELTRSVKAKGILQPLLVRRATGDQPFEIVFGHRRFRAAGKAGLTEAPCMVREMSDQEALEAQVVENCQRSDIHPMEEAESYELLHNTHRMPVEEIAAKVGRPQAYVYHRLLLLRLQPKIRKAFAADELTTGKALLLARIPDKKLQEQAFAEIRDADYHTVSLTEARKVIERQFMLRLKGAPFDPQDAALVAGAGACGSCPKRTGNQAELFSDIKGADLCTDPACFRKKQDAAWKVKVKEAEASGQRVITTQKELKKIFRYGDHQPAYESGYVSLDETFWNDGKVQAYRETLSDVEFTPILAQAPSGKRFELLPRKELNALLRKAGVKQGRTSSGSGRDYQKEQREKARVDGLVQAAVVEELQEKAEHVIDGLFVVLPANSPMHGIVEALGLGVIHRAWHDTLKAVATRRGLAKKGAGWNPGRELLKAAESMTSAHRLALILEVLAVGDSGDGYRSKADGSSAMTAACKLFGVNQGAISKRIRAAETKKRKAKAVKKANRKAAKKRSTRAGKSPAGSSRKKVAKKATSKKTTKKAPARKVRNRKETGGHK